jgi:hypothetical protein
VSNQPTDTRNSIVAIVTPDRTSFRRSLSYNDHEIPRISTTAPPIDQDQSKIGSRRSPRRTEPPPSPGAAKRQQNSPIRRSSSDHGHQNGIVRFQHLPPIPGSPDVTDVSSPPSPASRKSQSSIRTNGQSPQKPKESPSPNGKTNHDGSNMDSISRARSKAYVQHRSPPAQSLSAAVELFTGSENHSVSDSGHSHSSVREQSASDDSSYHSHGQMHDHYDQPRTPVRDKVKHGPPPSPQRPIPATPNGGFWRSTSTPVLAGREISGPVLNHGQSR